MTLFKNGPLVCTGKLLKQSKGNNQYDLLWKVNTPDKKLQSKRGFKAPCTSLMVVNLY